MFAPLNTVAAGRLRPKALWIVFACMAASAIGCGSRRVEVAKPEPLPLRLVALPAAAADVADVAGQAYAASIHGTAALMLAAIGEPGPRELATLYCGQRRLTSEQAFHLRDNRMAVILTGLRQLDAEVARYLGTCTGILEFSELDALEPAAAAALAGRRDVLRLNALRRLDAATARGLARSECDLQLKGLTRLEPGVAEALATHRGGLCLNSLETLSAEDARHLANHQGDLCLNGLVSLSDAGARELSRFRFGLHLNGLATLSVPAAAALAKHRGWCLGCHGLEVLCEDAAAAVARHPRSGASIVSRLVGGEGGLVSRQGG